MESSNERKWNEGSALSNLRLSYELCVAAIATDSFVIKGLFFVKSDFIFSFLQATPAKNGPAFLAGCFLPKPAAIH